MSEKIRSFEQLQAGEPNALEQLRVLVQDPEWNDGLKILYLQGMAFCSGELFSFDTSIFNTITPEDFTAYFPHSLRGIEYANTKWGEDAIPSNFAVYLALKHDTHGLIPRHIGYNGDKDEFGITIPHIFEEING